MSFSGTFAHFSWIEAENTALVTFTSNQPLLWFQRSLFDLKNFILILERYSENQIVIKRNQEFNEIIFLLEGEIELSFKLAGNKFARFFTKGFYFGEYNVLTNKPSEFTYTFKKTSKCFCFPRTKFLTIMAKYPSLRENILERSFQNYKSLNMTLVIR